MSKANKLLRWYRMTKQRGSSQNITARQAVIDGALLHQGPQLYHQLYVKATETAIYTLGVCGGEPNLSLHITAGIQ